MYTEDLRWTWVWIAMAYFWHCMHNEDLWLTWVWLWIAIALWHLMHTEDLKWTWVWIALVYFWHSMHTEGVEIIMDLSCNGLHLALNGRWGCWDYHGLNCSGLLLALYAYWRLKINMGKIFLALLHSTVYNLKIHVLLPELFYMTIS